MQQSKRGRKKVLGDNQGVILLRLPEQSYIKLKDYARSNNSNMAEIVRALVINHLESVKA